MARATFGDTTGDFTYDTVASGLVRLASATLTMWTAKVGGTQVTDLLLGSDPVSTITVGDDGQIPEFQGPDNVLVLWADGGAGRRVALVALRDVVAQAQAAAAAAELAADQAEAFGGTNNTQVAGFVNGAGPTRDAMRDGFVARTAPTKHAPALGLYFPEAEGATADGVADDSGAFTATVAALPQNGSSGAATIYLSSTRYRLNSQVTINKHGARVMAAGGYTTIINVGSGVTGAALKWGIAGSVIRGPQIENVVFAGEAGSTAGAIHMEGAYDQAVIRNVFAHSLRNGATGIKVSAPTGGAPVSQTLIAENSWVSFTTGQAGVSWHLQSVQETNFIGCKGLGGGEGVGTAWLLEDCKGLAFYGVSAAICEYGFDIFANTKSVEGFTFSGTTIEGCTNTLRTRRTGAFTISRIMWGEFRSQIATSISAGPFTLDGVVASTLNTRGIAVTINATCSQVHILTDDASQVTDNGVNSTIIGWGNANDGYKIKQTNRRVMLESTSGPGCDLKATGRTGRYRLFWNASSGADNGYALQYSADDSSFRSLHTIEAAGIVQHFNVWDGSAVVEALRLQRLPTSGNTAMWLMYHNGTGVVFQQVSLGAADSGGTGFKALRVPN